jgi:hypothetical protein
MSEQNESMEVSEEIQDQPIEESSEGSQEEIQFQDSEGGEEEELTSEQVVEAKEDLKSELKQMSKVLKLKVDGQEIEQMVDLNDEEGLKKLFQKGLAAEKRMHEAARQRKENEDLINFLQSNPEEALRRLGKDPELFAEEIITRKIKEMEMSPEEKAKLEMEKRLQEYEEKLQRIEQEKQETEKRALEERYATDLDQQITKALSDNPELPKSEYTVKRIANELYKYTQAGYDVTVSDVIPIIKKKMTSEIQQMFKLMPDESFEAWIGAENAKRLKEIRKKKVVSRPQVASNIPSVRREEPQKPTKKVRASDFFRKL